MLYLVVAVLAHDILDLDGRQHRVDPPCPSSDAPPPANDAAYRLRLVPAGDPLRPDSKP